MTDSHSDHSWLHPAIVVRESTLHGKGLFTTEDLGAGETVIKLGGVVITDADLRSLIPPYSSVGLGGDTHLLIQADDPVRYGNHSCDPNLWVDSTLQESARRFIRAGEELTIDYATQTARSDWTMLCVCRSPDCRKLISGEDWRSERLQRRYGDHWIPVLLRRIPRERPNEW